MTRWRMSLLVSPEACCLPSVDRHVGHSQHAPPVSRSVLSAFAEIFAHFVCQLLAQNSQRTFVPREPASQHATTSVFPVLGIFGLNRSKTRHAFEPLLARSSDWVVAEGKHNTHCNGAVVRVWSRLRVTSVVR